ncbi:MAG: phosphoglycerate dehydrogenase [Lachnospiraceae bacterium]|nr:phosphoglycerate dehydrogenase [Lachnospiraceae bacterium]
MKKIVSFFGDKTEVFCCLNRKAEEYAASLGIEYRWAPQLPFSEENVIRELQNADAGIIDIEPYGESVFSQVKDSTKLMVRFGVGFDKVDLKAASRNGIAIARTTGANTTAVAEMALTLMLTCRRRMNLYQARTRAGEWVKDIGNELIGSTVGIIGYGNIGRRLAKLLKGFDCRILAYDPFPNEEAVKADGVELVALEEILTQSDAISIHVPYTKETHHMINRETLTLMKPTAVIVNTARGNIIDEDALYQALKSGQIAGAGVDVFAAEPLSVESPLLTLENAVLTPHVSSQTMESLWNIYKMAIDISADFFAGKGSPHILNPDYIENK